MKKKKSSIGCLFWIALILLVLVIFLFNRNTINAVLEKTGFLQLIEKTQDSDEPDLIEEPANEDNSESEVIEDEDGSEPITEITPEEDLTVEITPEEEPAETVEPEQEVPLADKKIRRSRLYFAEYNDTEGMLYIKSIVRPVYYVNSPLTDTIAALIKGLTPSELNAGMISLIPNGTELISITLTDGIASINFNDTFRFNSLGLEGYTAQLKQIVFTATEFPTVKFVQILIEGKKYDYFGTEGIFIGDPLSKESFN